MKKTQIKMEEFLESRLNEVSMNKLRGGDGPNYPVNPPDPPPGK
jgi:hypothetical protein